MIAYAFDGTWEGLLNVVFVAFQKKTFPDFLFREGLSPPFLASRVSRIATEEARTDRVWTGLRRQLSPLGLHNLLLVWLLEDPEADELLFRFMVKIFQNVPETDFGDPDVLSLRQKARLVNTEKHHLIEFIRFQKTVDDLYFAPVKPRYNVTPLILNHFRQRFGDQKWVIYDLLRNYGFFYDLHELKEIKLEFPPELEQGALAASTLASEELLYQELWRTYFKSVTIEERLNPRLQRRCLPRRFWPLLTEMQTEAGQRPVCERGIGE